MLLELAEALDGSSRQKTFVFVSTDGAAADNAGARRFADHYPDRGKVDAVLVLEDLGAADAAPAVGGAVVDRLATRSLQVARTASAELERETGAGSRLAVVARPVPAPGVAADAA